MMSLEFDQSLLKVQQANKDYQIALLVLELFHNTSQIKESAELVVITSKKLRDAAQQYTEHHPLPFYS